MIIRLCMYRLRDNNPRNEAENCFWFLPPKLASKMREEEVELGMGRAGTRANSARHDLSPAQHELAMSTARHAGTSWAMGHA